MCTFASTVCVYNSYARVHVGLGERRTATCLQELRSFTRSAVYAYRYRVLVSCQNTFSLGRVAADVSWAG